MTTLPPSICPLGYPWSQLEEIFDAQELARLRLWMYGQTGAICEGQRWDPLGRKYEPDACSPHPHGMVVYGSDIRRWMEALPVID